jgi:Kef-type K+ transport system membrane component KefB
MADLLSFLTVIAAGLFFAEFLRPYHLPYVIVLIFSGMVIGPHALGVFTPDVTIEFMGEIGLVFLMFMAGLETRHSHMAKQKKGMVMIAVLNGGIPFLVGTGIALYLGYNWISALLLGTIFISSSIAVIIPSLETSGLLKKPLGKAVLGGTVVADVLSLILLAFILQLFGPHTDIPFVLFYVMVFLFLIFLKSFIKELKIFFMEHHKCRSDPFEDELRFTFVVLLGTVLVFDFIGLHPILAGFFAGMSLNGKEVRDMLKRKLHVISYGLFIPIFFVLIGAQADISVFGNGGDALMLVVVVVGASVLSKFLSGFAAGKLLGFRDRESALIGSSTIPQLSTTLAVAFTGLELGLLEPKMVMAMTVLSMVTTFAGPFMVNSLLHSNVKQ